MENTKVLLVDDEQDIIEFVKYNLEREGYWIETANNGKEALEVAVKFQPALILLDVMMPEMDGVEVCREIRAADLEKQAIIAFLTARNEDYSQIAGFEAGGDDYIAKPIRPKVLISRIKALLKRRHIGNSIKEENPNIVFGEFELLKDEYIIKKGNEDISLAKKEFELVKLLASRPGKVFTREEIYNKIWGSDIIIGDRTIDVHIRKLREKLDENIISTIKGVGYKLNA